MPVVVTDSNGVTSAIESIVFNNGTDEHILYQEPIVEVSGSLPLAFTGTRQRALDNYTVHGTAEGAGVETENLFDYMAQNPEKGFSANRLLRSTGYTGQTQTSDISEYIKLEQNTDYFLLWAVTASTTASFCLYDENKSYITGYAYSSYGAVAGGTFNSGTAKYLRLTVSHNYAGSIMLVKDSAAPISYIPHGFKIPLTNTSGVTENLWDENYENISTNLLYKSLNVGDGEFTLSTTTPLYSGACCLFLMAGQQTSGAKTSSDGASANLSRTVTSVGGYVTVVYRKYGTVDPRDYQTMLTKGSIAPDHYIPHRYTADYNLYIGSTKLGADEYLSFAEQKIYKDVSGTLTPTDPPLPFPAISAYQGENTLSSTETVGEVTVKGRLVDTTN